MLDTFAAVPRERFVPEAYRAVAFADAPIPIGHGQFMLPPVLEGRILQALAPVRGERVLESRHRKRLFRRLPRAPAPGPSTASRSTRIWLRAPRARWASRAMPRVSIETADALARDFEPAYEIVAVTGSLPAPERRLERALVVGGRMFVVIGSGPRWKPAS